MRSPSESAARNIVDQLKREKYKPKGVLNMNDMRKGMFICLLLQFYLFIRVPSSADELAFLKIKNVEEKIGEKAVRSLLKPMEMISE